jgi:uncharacterized membrane protein YbhN (UPF0104 family)
LRLALSLTTIVKLTLVGVLLYTTISSDFFAAFQTGFSWTFLHGALAVQPIIVFCLVVLSMRHVVLVGTPKVRIAIAFRAMVLSQGLNVLLPARLSELLKATYLRDHAGVPLSVGLSAVVLERTVDVLIVAGLGLLGLAQFFDRGNFGAVLALGVVCVLAMLFLVKSRILLLRLVRSLPWLRISGFLERAYLHFAETAGTRAFWLALLLGLVGWGASYINILIFIELGGSASIGLSGALLVFVLTTLGAAVPALPGGIGTYEAAAVIALRSLGYAFDEALALAIAMHVTQLVLPFVLSMLIMLTERLGFSSLLADLRASAQASVGSHTAELHSSSHD